MRPIGEFLERAGYGLALVGGIVFASVFAIVLVNGSWPDFLRPIQARFVIISDILGPFTFMAELVLFVGPGFLVVLLGQKLKGSNSN